MRTRSAVLIALVALIVASPVGSVPISQARFTVAVEASATFTTASTFDVTPPAGADVQTANGGSTAGQPEAGDALTLTFTEPIDPASVLGGWTGSSTAIVVRIADGDLLGSDVLTVRTVTNAAQLPLGTIALGASGYVSQLRDFGATGTPSTMELSGTSIVIVLGTPSGSTGNDLVGGSMTWTPEAAVTDLAGNPCRTDTVTESDLLVDPEF